MQHRELAQRSVVTRRGGIGDVGREAEEGVYQHVYIRMILNIVQQELT